MANWLQDALSDEDKQKLNSYLMTLNQPKPEEVSQPAQPLSPEAESIASKITGMSNGSTNVSADPTMAMKPQIKSAPTVQADDEQDETPIERTPATAQPAISPTDKQAVQNYIKQKYNLLSPESYDTQMKAAQDDANNRKSNLGIAQFLSGLGSAMAGKGPEQAAQTFDSIRGQIDKNTVGELQNRHDAQMQNLNSNQKIDEMQRTQDSFDPNSKASQSFRKIIETNFPNVAKTYGDSWKDVTASDKDNIFEPLKLKENIEARKQQFQLQQQLRNDDKVTKLAKAMKDDLDADKGRSGNFGQISAKVQSAERLEGLVQSFKDGNLPPAQMEELALGLSNMLAPGGGTSRAQVEALVPHTAIGDASKLKNWLFNEPGGSNQQKFVEQMSHTIQREKDIANGQLNQIRSQRLPIHAELKKRSPDMYNALLHSYKMDGSGNEKSMSSQSPNMSDEDKQAIEWAKANPNDPRSKQILQLHGM